MENNGNSGGLFGNLYGVVNNDNDWDDQTSDVPVFIDDVDWDMMQDLNRNNTDRAVGGGSNFGGSRQQ